MLIDFGPSVAQPDNRNSAKQRGASTKTLRFSWQNSRIFITSINPPILHLLIYFFSLKRPKHFLAFLPLCSKALVKPFGSIFHTVDGAISPISPFVLPVFDSSFRALTDGFTAPLSEFLTIFHTIPNVFPTIPPPILSRLYAFFHTKAVSSGVIRHPKRGAAKH
jgi:hypothetical protein